MEIHIEKFELEKNVYVHCPIYLEAFFIINIKSLFKCNNQKGLFYLPPGGLQIFKNNYYAKF